MLDEASKTGSKVPRLTENRLVTLALEYPEYDDLIIREGGKKLLAVSRQLFDRIGERAQLEIVLTESGEPEFKMTAITLDSAN
jgi:hypothetical protein